MLLFVLVVIVVVASLEEDWRQVILIAETDQHTGQRDIMAVDVATDEIVNLSNGRCADPHWSQPWEPVGGKNKVVFRQFQGPPDYVSRIFVAEQNATGFWLLNQLSDTFKQALFFTWLHDDTMFAFVAKAESGTGSEIVVVKGLQVAHRIAIDGKNPVWTKWSPDGAWIGVSIDQGVFLASPDGTKTKKVDADNDVFAWREDGQALIVVRNQDLVIVNLDGKVIKPFSVTTKEIFDCSPDGKYVAIQGQKTPQGRSVDVLTVQDESTEPINVPGDNNCAKFSPNSQWIAFFNISPTGVCTLGVVHPPDEGYKELAACEDCGYMPPSWVTIRWV